jgi:3-dehydroquinate dehydratase type I
MKICVPVSTPSAREALRAIGEAAVAADLVELRMDAIGGVPLAALLAGAGSSSPPPAVVVTNRRREEGGMRPPADDEGPDDAARRRVDVLIEAVNLGAEFVDVELSTEAHLREALREAIARRGFRTSLIVSHHDFRRTPSLRRLKSIYDRCADAGAAIVKIVTTAVQPRDNLRILELVVHARRNGQPIIAFCMGEAGKISRLAAPILGAEFGFACLRKGEGSAPGQLTVREMRRAMKIIGGEGKKA